MTTIDLPSPRPAVPACIDDLRSLLGPHVSVESAARRLASRDHAWMSPVLDTLTPPDAIADVVVSPGTADDLAKVLGTAHRHGAAVTVRGKGTGNYGQSIPLAQGIVVDMASRFDSSISVEQGWLTAGAGASFTRMETAAAATGQELAMFPSTVSSTLGGFLSGGAGGTGSIENGFIWDGFADTLWMLPCWDQPEPAMIGAGDVGAHLHAYGTTGVITAARIALVPARSWTAVFASFADFAPAAAAGRSVLDTEPALRSLSVDDARTVASLPAHPAMPAGRASLRVVAAADSVGAVERVVTAAGGTVTLVDPGATSLCVSLSYNHITLRAKRADPSVCHLQVGGDAVVDRYDDVIAVLPDGRVHLDAHAPGGVRGFGGLLLSTYLDEPTLRRGMRILEDLDVRVMDPHTWRLGGHGPNDAMVAAAVAGDPLGLLNPGKLDRPVEADAGPLRG
jgi:FAD/FMN-containing dehydrogenase